MTKSLPAPDILFFRNAPEPGSESPVPFPAFAGAQPEIWRPTAFAVKPSGFPLYPFAMWWFFHWCGVFENPGYRIYLLREAGNPVHRSCVFPPFFRFPFMAAGDLQIGDIWTAESRRGQGIAAQVLRCILQNHRDRALWFLCAKENEASIKLATSAGMRLYGTGHRSKRVGMSLLGRFEMAT